MRHNKKEIIMKRRRKFNFESAKIIAEKYLLQLNPTARIEHWVFEDLNSVFFYQNVPNGSSIMVGSDGSFLFFNRNISPTTAREKFELGKRSTNTEFLELLQLSQTRIL